MQTIRNFIYLFSLFSLTTQPHILLANTLPHRFIGSGNETDYEALLAFKAGISNDPSSVLSSWNNSLHFCQWEGVTCGRKHRRVISLALPSNNLFGKLSPFIGNLSFLLNLNLSTNSFRGNIPHQISSLSRLKILTFRKNSFEGEIPANLSSCLHLRMLDLSTNKLSGRIPAEVATFPNLMYLYLYDNNLSGSLQAIGIGNMSTSLQSLYLAQNPLHGSIPYDIGRLKNLAYLVLGNIQLLSGTIPASLFNLSNLYGLYLSHSKIRGHLPQDLGLRLPQLRHLYISNTSLSGKLPTSLSNLSKLNLLDISFNSFTGKFFLNGNNWPLLSDLLMNSAFSLGGEARDISFLDTLTNCTNLIQFSAHSISFTGILPQSVLNLSTSLKYLVLSQNQISGQLPPGLGKFVNLIALDLGENIISGPIPADIGKMKRLEQVYFHYNNFSGKIPSSLGNLTKLSTLYMDYNNLEGSLPRSLGNCRNLQTLSLPFNELSGVIPVELFNASSILNLWINQNNLQGSLPDDIIFLNDLFLLDVSGNRLSGRIPTTLGGCMSLSALNMSKNSFMRSIPESFSALKSIQSLDLSYNNLSGQIPSYFSTWPYLSSLNLSFNSLVGEVPVNGVFSNTSVVSVVGNNKLCGGVPGLHLPKCTPRREPNRRKLPLKVIVIISFACALIVILLVASCFYFLCSQRKGKSIPSGLQNIKPVLDVSYQILSRATNGFSQSNLLGVGGFGSVYKGIMHQDDKEMVVAIKVLNLQNKGAGKSFIAECNALRGIRHRNLVKIITVCSSIDSLRKDFKALIFEFMPRGSLENWLHSSNLATNEHVDGDQSCSLSLFQRLSIAIDVGCALEYLHIECASSIIHCDLKPSNILLDDEMTAHVGDFGLAKFISGASTSGIGNHTSSTQVRGTVGYATPEYGLGSKVSPEGDIYSFGIVVLEMMTSKKPTDTMFSNGLSLHDFAKSALPDRVMEIIDQIMLGDAILLPARSGADIKKMECIKSLIMIGVQCSLELPQERMKISDAVNNLRSARQMLLPTRA